MSCETVNGKTSILGLIGNPVGHSISPQIHNTISRCLELDYIYVPFQVESSRLENAVHGLKALNVKGFNVTVPHKSHVLDYVDGMTEEVRMIGAANTVKNIDGRFHAYNTDAEGFYRSFREAAGMGVEGKTVTILGAGGAARAVAVKIALEGAAQLYIVNRSCEKAEALAGAINGKTGCAIKAAALQDQKLWEYIADSDVIINSTSSGMSPNIGEVPLDIAGRLHSGQFVMDLIYNPERTLLLKEAEKQGCKVINGLGMLIYQAVAAYEIWTGIRVPDAIIASLFRMCGN